VYVIYWAKQGGDYMSVADYTCPARILAIKNQRGDDETYANSCRKLRLGPDSSTAKVASSGAELLIDDAQHDDSFTRKELAKEFGVQKVRLVPCNEGVLECGLASTRSFGEGSLVGLGAGIAAALAFCAYIFYSRGLADATTWLSCYVIEYSLSVDNLFVFIIIFKYFKVPRQLQSDVLNYGIFGAIIFRFVFVYLGAIVLQQFSFLILGFAGILLYAAYQGLTGEDDDEDDDEDLEDNFIVQNLRKVFDVSAEYDGSNFITEVQGKSMVTPLLICLLTIEISDIVFATDSVPAVLGTTSDQFIAYTSNVFAVYGLRTLFFLLDEAIASFSYLEKAVNFVLGFIGFKIIVDYFEIVQIDVLISLVVVLGTLLTGVALSVIEMQGGKQEQQADAV
jgi:TerC family integral membrane protein